MKKCMFKSDCEKKLSSICCSECDVKKCWQRCKDDPEECGLQQTEPTTMEIIYYNIVNKVGKMKSFERGVLKDEEVTTKDKLVEYRAEEIDDKLSEFNKGGRKLWSAVECRRETIILEN